MPYSMRRGRETGLSCVIFLWLAGCAGESASVSTERQIDELTYERARIRDSLTEAMGDAEKLRRDVDALATERASLQKQLADLGSSLRSVNTELASAVKERESLKVKLSDSEKGYERVQASLEKVRSVASASAGELADLRLKNQELEESVRNLQKAHGTVGEENRTLVSEVENLRDELTRTRAVLRSLREGTPEQESIERLTTQVHNLERQYADLQGEKVALQKRIDTITAERNSSREPSPEMTATGVVYRKNPKGLIHEVSTLVKDRYEAGLRGEFQWDYFDFAILGAAVLALLFLYWMFIRWIRVRRLKKQIRTLTTRVHELEHVSQRHSAETVETPDPAVARTESFRSRRPSMRRSGFSAVISNKEVTREAPRLAAEKREEPVSAVEALEIPRAVAPAKPLPKASPKPVAAKSWNEDTSSEDALANTQIMSKLSEEDQDRAVDAVLSLSGAPEPGARRPGASRPSPSPAPKSDPKKNDDAELLAELKSVINKKFDELMK
jgi:predicted nuclease with TOPRIM domain